MTRRASISRWTSAREAAARHHPRGRGAHRPGVPWSRCGPSSAARPSRVGVAGSGALFLPRAAQQMERREVALELGRALVALGGLAGWAMIAVLAAG